MTSPSGAAMPRRGALAAGVSAFGAAEPVASAQGAPSTGHVVLLGDSVFDNAGHLAGRGPDMIGQLRARLPPGWRATLLARGGAVTAEVAGQLGRLPPDATHCAISAGGNDAGRQEGVLDEPVRSVAEALGRIASASERFAEEYRAMLDAVSARRLPSAVCTVYDPRFADRIRRRVAAAGLAAFNDAITREAFARGLALIDLRLVCGSDEDFADATGPSARGGVKIVSAIAGWASGNGQVRRRRSEVFAGEEGGG